MAGFEFIGKEERDQVNEVFDKGGVLFRHGFEAMRNGVYKVKEFEKEFSQKFGVSYCRAVSSGTAALLVALKALGVKPGDEVITQSFTFVATAEAIIAAGAVPVITEINETLNMDPEDLERKITDKTKVIIPVHMMGGPCQMQEICEIAKKRGILILEDTAQGLGGEYKGKKLGTIGDAGIFSFDFGKGLTTGEGGMVVTNDKEIYERAKEYSDHGHQDNPNFPRGEDTRQMPGFNFSMMELQGAVGLAQLRKFDYGLLKQRENKKKLKEKLSRIKGIKFRQITDAEGDTGDTIVFFVGNPEGPRQVGTNVASPEGSRLQRDNGVNKERAQKFAKFLTNNGIGTKNVPSAINWHFAGTWKHMLPQFSQYRGKDLNEFWPKSSEILRQSIAISILAKMPDEEINRIAEVINKAFEEI